MSDGLKIRPFRPGDVAAVAMVASECFDRFIRPLYSEEGVRSFAAYVYPEALAKRQSENCQMFVAELGSEIAGVIELRDFRHISMLFVTPELHNCGIATRLLERALRMAKKAVPELAEITVFSAPGAVKVYRAWGFVETAPETVAGGIRYTPMKLAL